MKVAVSVINPLPSFFLPGVAFFDGIWSFRRSTTLHVLFRSLCVRFTKEGRFSFSDQTGPFSCTFRRRSRGKLFLWRVKLGPPFLVRMLCFCWRLMTPFRTVLFDNQVFFFFFFFPRLPFFRRQSSLTQVFSVDSFRLLRVRGSFLSLARTPPFADPPFFRGAEIVLFPDPWLPLARVALDRDHRFSPNRRHGGFPLFFPHPILLFIFPRAGSSRSPFS